MSSVSVEMMIQKFEILPDQAKNNRSINDEYRNRT